MISNSLNRVVLLKDCLIKLKSGSNCGSNIVLASLRACSFSSWYDMNDPGKVSSGKQTSIPETKLHRHESDDRLVWVDCEMTGLDVDKDRLLEVAMIITDGNLEEIVTCGPLVVKTDEQVLSNMNDWCKKSHRKSGLWKACLESNLSIEDVDNQLSQILADKSIQVAALAGNSVSFDRMFLKKYCPKFGSLLHYRMVDVSTIKEVVRRWYPEEPNHSKKLNHRALDDIRESIEELRHYREKFFKTPSQVNKEKSSTR